MPRTFLLLLSLLTAFSLTGAASAALVTSLTLDYGLVNDGRMRYEYTLLNAAESEFPLDLFLLDTGENVTLEIEAPTGWVVDFAPDEETYELLFLASDDAVLAPGETATFVLLTPSEPRELQYFVANQAESSNEGGYVLDVILAPFRPYALHPGDTNADGLVDLLDLNNVRNQFAQTGNPILGDTEPFDGKVGLYDLNQVRNHFGNDYNNPAVPEPATLGLAVLGVVVGLAWRRWSMARDGATC